MTRCRICQGNTRRRIGVCVRCRRSNAKPVLIKSRQLIGKQSACASSSEASNE